MSSDNFILRIKSYKGEYAVRESNTVPEYKYYIIDKQVHAIYRGIHNLPRERVLLLDANELTKSFENIHTIIDWLIDNKIRRNDTVCVIGGGTIQDASSFALSIFKRGIQWVYVPTTLLAQADSCIGSKTSINYKGYKNQIGTFYPPNEVIINTNYLTTLTRIDILSGIGEILKIHLIGGYDIAEIREKIDNHEWKSLIRSSLKIKSEYIEKDEFDYGIRKMLNYGHTFGHALESMSNYTIPHGIAVMIGIMASNHIAYSWGYLTDLYHEINSILKNYIPKEMLEKAKQLISSPNISYFLQDKKAANRRIALIIMTSPGNMKLDYISARDVVEYGKSMLRYW